MARRIASFLLALLMFFFIVQHVASAESNTAEENGFRINKQTGELLDYRYKYKLHGDVVIPESVAGVKVTSVGARVFECCNFKSVTIPEGVTAIKSEAFFQCSELETVILPDSLEEIEKSAFSLCEKLQTVTIPSNVTTIGADAFFGSGLLSVTIPASVTSIVANPFGGCSNLTSITVSSGNPVYTVDSHGVLFDQSKAKLVAYPAGNAALAYTVPSTVKIIGESAFKFCKKIDEVMISEGVTQIEKSAFCDCTSLTHISLPKSIKEISDWAFSGCESLTEISLPPVGIIRDHILNACMSLSSIVLPEGVRIIEDEAFRGCWGLKEITLPSSLREIKGDPFEVCENLKDIYYLGTESQWNEIDMSWEAWKSLQGITVHYAAAGDNPPPTETERPEDNAVLTLIDCSLKDESGQTDIVSAGLVLQFSAELNQNPNWLHGSIYIKDYETGTVILEIDSREFYSRGGTIFGNVVSIPYAFCNLTSGKYYIAIDANLFWASTANADGTIARFSGLSEKDELCFVLNPSGSLGELKEIDFFAFTILVYEDLEVGRTVAEHLASRWKSNWAETDITYEELFGNIANWTVCKIGSSKLGFYAAAFANTDNEVVIAYRGSESVSDAIKFENTDAYSDWFLNDFPMELFNTAGQQLYDVIDFYNSVAVDAKTIAVTGHSLGGGWGDVVSAYSGCKGVTFNAISVLDVVYDAVPRLMSARYEGLDRWNFVDHINQYDYLAGAFEVFTSNRVKPYFAHQSNNAVTKLGASHSLSSFVSKQNGEVQLNPVVQTFFPQESITSDMFIGAGSVDFGSSKSDIFALGRSDNTKVKTSYGGDGDDQIYSGIWDDTLVGGRGNDILDGGWGSDTYYYNKGDGVDTIYDISGEDVLLLFGYTEDDRITVNEDSSEFAEVQCNGQTIVRIWKTGRRGTFTIKSAGEMAQMLTTVGIYEVQFSYQICCPVDIEVLDANGNVVYTFYDGTIGAEYTEYGNFYGFWEEGGNYGKSIDLFDGYSIRIVGLRDGSMDITAWSVSKNELSDVSYSYENIPVSDTMTAEIELRKSKATLEIESSEGTETLTLNQNKLNEPVKEDFLTRNSPNKDKDSKPILPIIVILTCVVAICVAVFIKKKRTRH